MTIIELVLVIAASFGLKCLYEKAENYTHDKDNFSIIAAYSAMHLPQAHKDISALRLTYDSDKIRQIQDLTQYSLGKTLKHVHDSGVNNINLHLACHGQPNGTLQFDDDMVDSYKIIDLMPSGGVNVLLLMSCYGETIGPYIVGRNAAKHVIYCLHNHSIPNDHASQITRVFWQEIHRNHNNVRVAYRAMHKRLPYDIAENIRITSYNTEGCKKKGMIKRWLTKYLF